jgi:hypothetical protein
MTFDWNRPYVELAAMEHYEALDRKIAALYGKRVKATLLSNVEYKIRYGEFHATRRMKPPWSCSRIFPGYLVVRKLGTAEQYETWMPEHVFEELYGPRSSTAAAVEGEA